MTTPAWLTEARRHLGLREIPGKQHSPVISGWLRSLKAWWTDDETPWCGVFVAHCMREAGIELPQHWYRAKGWLDWGVSQPSARVGSVVIFAREGGGHVAIAIGKDKLGRLICIGGNQGNAVTVAAFEPIRVIGYRWPTRLPPPTEPLPLVDFNGKPSAGEA